MRLKLAFQSMKGKTIVQLALEMVSSLKLQHEKDALEVGWERIILQV